MADYTGTAKYIGKSVNNENMFYTEHELAQALANTDTISITAPAGVEKDVVPYSIACWSAAAPRVLQVNYAMTSYNKTTGVLVITATGDVADNSTFVIHWGLATTGS